MPSSQCLKNHFLFGGVKSEKVGLFSIDEPQSKRLSWGLLVWGAQWRRILSAKAMPVEPT